MVGKVKIQLTKEKEVYNFCKPYVIAEIGANHNETDYGSTTNDIDNQAYGVSYAVNDDLTISYQVVTNSKDTAAQDEQITQIAASYTMGSISFSGYVGKQSDVSGTAGSDDAEKHISMSLSF